ncbi:hypothetical protein [Paracraurococcus lichenis]|uniref:Uncharacterized protein n=1 Tax=Paracraurococcus lichenis TaxID=3064888 RepID=A0ABT9EE06_9PROT|nr:hypothetical protein [Paracraurococcus sp. LOR1-02]MDO9714452.1 hypothetical protein [Paracraurococcus sp. LOR1-02]
MQRCPDRRREKSASRTPQAELFALPGAASDPVGAVWPALPEGTRQALTGLLARLLLERSPRVGYQRQQQPELQS